MSTLHWLNSSKFNRMATCRNACASSMFKIFGPIDRQLYIVYFQIIGFYRHQIYCCCLRSPSSLHSLFSFFFFFIVDNTCISYRFAESKAFSCMNEQYRVKINMFSCELIWLPEIGIHFKCFVDNLSEITNPFFHSLFHFPRSYFRNNKQNESGSYRIENQLRRHLSM